MDLKEAEYFHLRAPILTNRSNTYLSKQLGSALADLSWSRPFLPSRALDMSLLAIFS